jgi:putative DNA methylase
VFAPFLMTYRKKLIEVALPLEAINAESAREKSIRHGHPSTLHLWWARRPLAACRAVLWSSLVDDPASWPEKFPTEEAQNAERQRLFDILARFETETDKKGNQKQVVRGLVSWDEVNDPKSQVLPIAQKEIARCLAWERGEEPPIEVEAVREYIARYAPPAYDPFAGGGSIPLEAQRLGLEAHASDLNPVAVLINKALIEIPPKFRDSPPTNPADRVRAKLESWKGAQGLAADVRYYGQWMRDEAFQKIGHLYPKVDLPQNLGGGEATVIAWLWARTVKCPNPACGCQMPLVRSFQLSTKKGKEAWVEPVIDRSSVPPSIKFEVKTGEGEAPEGTVERKGARCIACDMPVPLDHVREEGRAGRMNAQLMAIVAEGKRGRVYLSPKQEQVEIAIKAQPKWKPEADLPHNPRDFKTPNYGMRTFADLFTPRQLVALSTFSDLVGDALKKAVTDAIDAGLPNDDIPLNDGGTGARAYGEAIATYLALGASKICDYNSALVLWSQTRNQAKSTFARQALPMVWDFAEVNIFAKAAGDISTTLNGIIDTLDKLIPSKVFGKSEQVDATKLNVNFTNILISTDPPYYDNIGYADLSDFFYVWLRHSIQSIYLNLFGTLLVPKAQELVATPYRFEGNKQKAQAFFENGLGEAFHRIHDISHEGYPFTVYYAFKQAESDTDVEGSDSIASTGWETMLEGLVKADFSIGGTWPMRTERSVRSIGIGSNALASSIVLVCRPRPTDAPKATRRQFTSELKRELPPALRLLQQGNIAPVDLAQASIGPGMAIYSKYAAVLEADGSPMRVRAALQLINQILDEYLTEQEGEFDGDTRWALTWFEQHQFDKGIYGDAETLSKAKNTSVQGLVEAGILEAKAGKVRLLPRSELAAKWQPDQDERMPVWEITQHLIRALDQTGETGAANMLAKLGDRGSLAKDLAYRLYSLCDRKNWSQEALAYNSLVISWPEITRLANEIQPEPPAQTALNF